MTAIEIANVREKLSNAQQASEGTFSVIDCTHKYSRTKESRRSICESSWEHCSVHLI